MNKLPVRTGYKLASEPVGYLDAKIIEKLVGLVHARRTYTPYPHVRVDTAREYLKEDNEILRVWALEQFGEHLAKQDTDSAEILRRAWNKAIGEAEAEKVLWTPAIDHLIEYCLTGSERDEEVYNTHPLVPLALAQLERLKEWVQKHPMAENISEINSFKSKRLWRMVAEFSVSIGETDIELVVGRDDAKLFLALLRNQAVGDAWVLARLKDISLWSQNPNGKAACYINWGKILVDESLKRFGGIGPLTAEELLTNKGNPINKNLDPSLVNKIDEAVLQHPEVTRNLVYQIWRRSNYIDNRLKALNHTVVRQEAVEWLKQEVSVGRNIDQSIIRGLAGYMNGNPDLIEWLATLNITSIHTAVNLVAHPFTTAENAIKVGQTHLSDQRMRAALATRDDTRNDPRIAKILQKSNSREVMEVMLSKAQSTAELTETLRRMLKKDMDVALDVLMRMTIEPGIVLPQALFKQVLISSDKELKIKAMNVIRRWDSAGALVNSQPERPINGPQRQ